jgi:hypothetical protein
VNSRFHTCVIIGFGVRIVKFRRDELFLSETNSICARLSRHVNRLLVARIGRIP